MAVYEIEIDGKIYEVDDSSLGQYVNPQTGELQIDVVAEDLRKSAGEQNAPSKSDLMSDLQEAGDTVEYIGDVVRGRGNNLGGALRNVAQGATVTAADEIEAGARATKQYIRNIDPTVSQEKKTGESWRELYNKYLQNARESYQGYMAQNPNKALALNLAGGILPGLITFGATAPASAATLGQTVFRMGLAGTGYGALGGFLSGEGGLSERLASAQEGAWRGGLTGALIPVGVSGAKDALTIGSRIRKGLGKNPMSKGEITESMFGLLANNADDLDNALLLGEAVRKGDKGIQQAAKDINTINQLAKKAESKGYNRGIVEGYNEITERIKTPEMLAAEQAYADFAAQVPAGTNSGMAISNFFRKHPTAASIWEKYAEKTPKVNPNSFEGMRDINTALRARMKRASRADNFALVDDIQDALDDLSVIRENTTPGIKAIDRQYSIARNAQDVVDDNFFANIKHITAPKEIQQPVASGTEGVRLGFKPYVRGKARELLSEGGLRQPYSETLNLPSQILQKAGLPGSQNTLSESLLFNPAMFLQGL